MSSFASGQTREEVLDKGLRNDDAYSAYLMKKSKNSSSIEKTAALEEAIKFSPDTPGYYFKMAWRKLPNLLVSLNYFIDGVKAYSRSFWWTFNLLGLLYISLMASFIATLYVIAGMRVWADIDLIAHDINEHRVKFALAALPLIFAFLGPVFLVLPLLFITNIYSKKKNKIVFYLCAIMLFFAPFYIRLTDNFYSAHNPQMRAIVAVNEGRNNRVAVEVLKDAKDFPSRFSRAIAIKREGDLNAAAAIYGEIISETNDPRALTNLGNVYLAAGQYNVAKDYYKKAADQNKSVVTLYNMSQVAREELRYDDGEKYYNEALSIDKDKVTDFTASAGRTPNRLVVEETVGKNEMWEIATSAKKDFLKIFPVTPYAVSFASAALIIAFIIVDSKTKDRAFKCTKCGRVVCNKCNKGIQWGKLCGDCHKEGQAASDENPRARIARMLAGHEQRQRMVDRMRMMSFLPPGLAQAYSGRTLAGLVYMWLFSFPLMTLILNPLFKTGMAGMSHSWLFMPMTAIMIVVYIVSYVTINGRIEKGWL